MTPARAILTCTLVPVAAMGCGACTWRDGDTQRTLVLGLGVVSTTGSPHGGDAVAEATRTRAVGLVLMPDVAVLGAWTRHQLRVAPGADAQIEALDDGDGQFRTLARTFDAARRPECGLSLLSRRCLCPQCDQCERRRSGAEAAGGHAR